MRQAVRDELCPACRHPRVLHDRRGCAAFLGAFRATSDARKYCPCTECEERDIAFDRLWAMRTRGAP